MTIVRQVDSLLLRRPWLADCFLVAVYALTRLPEVLAVSTFPALVFPLESFYLTSLLFDGWSVRPEIATALASPANATLIYPPGIYLFSAVFSNAASLYWTLFVFQLAVGPLAYRLVTKALPGTGALLLAILAIYFCTRCNWWAPDFLIQPLMLGALLILIADPTATRGRAASLLILGQLAGLIILFKHNIGVFFSILCGTWIFFGAIRPAEQLKLPTGRLIAGFLLAGFFAFAIIFGSRLIHFDEAIYFLGPYVLFWGMFAIVLRRSRIRFEVWRFVKEAGLFSASALIVPSIFFVMLGSVFGYERYWHSLFGMGLQYLPIWDHGIVGIVTLNFHGSGAFQVLAGMFFALLFLLPFMTNCLAVVHLVRGTFRPSGELARTLSDFRIAGLGIMAIFMLFPLEGYHILATKLLVWGFVGLHFFGRSSWKGVDTLPWLLAPLVAMVIGHSALRLVTVMRLETAPGSPVVASVVGLPMQADIATQLSRQVEILQRSVKGASYYVVDSSGGALIGLAALVHNGLPQYYVEMRPGILSREVVDAIKADILRRSFVVVNLADYAREQPHGADPYMREILNFVDQHFVVVDSFRGPEPMPASAAQIYGFVVMQIRNGYLKTNE